MNSLRILLRLLTHGERDLARRLHTVAQRHQVEHEIHHVALDLAGWSREHAARLVDVATGYGLQLTDRRPPATLPVLANLRRGMSHSLAHRAEPGLLLLRDLRELHLAATENSLHWEMLAQAGQAATDQTLLGLASRCHPQTLRQMRWTNTMIKTLSPQILSSLS
jgi:hypothetical protein